MKIKIMLNYTYYILIIALLFHLNNFKEIRSKTCCNSKLNMNKTIMYPLFDRNTKYKTSKMTAYLWKQCGGIGWSGPVVCESQTKCKIINIYFHQCVPKRY